MKRIIKKIIPSKLSYMIGHLLHFDRKPYSLSLEIGKIKGISDFFVYSKSCEEINFVAENVRALINNEKIKVIHVFKFFSAQGYIIDEQHFISDDYAVRLPLKVKSEDKYISFTHHVETTNRDLDIFEDSDKKFIGNCFPISRGMTIYSLKKGDLGSSVHGNFGGISNENISYARLRSEYAYTPIYKFNNYDNYDLVFNNPTNNELLISLKCNNSGKIENLLIPSRGTDFYNLSNYEGSITFISKLPICRCIVFKNPNLRKNFANFDVFHS